VEAVDLVEAVAVLVGQVVVVADVPVVEAPHNE
jgi:hypothetical protein